MTRCAGRQRIAEPRPPLPKRQARRAEAAALQFNSDLLPTRKRTGNRNRCAMFWCNDLSGQHRRDFNSPEVRMGRIRACQPPVQTLNSGTHSEPRFPSGNVTEPSCIGNVVALVAGTPLCEYYSWGGHPSSVISSMNSIKLIAFVGPPPMLNALPVSSLCSRTRAASHQQDHRQTKYPALAFHPHKELLAHH